MLMLMEQLTPQTSVQPRQCRAGLKRARSGAEELFRGALNRRPGHEAGNAAR